MGFKCGIVGLPNVGKSTLFNALTKATIAAENYPFCTIEPNIGMVPVPDQRLDQIAHYVSPEKIIPTTLEFVDIAGLVEGASKGEGLGNQFLANIRETHAIAHVVRCFQDDDVVHVSGKVNPINDIDVINTELLLADLEMVERSLERAKKQAKSQDKEAKQTVLILEQLLEHLGEGAPVRTFSGDLTQTLYCRHLQFLTQKPVMYIANVNEDTLTSGQSPELEMVKAHAQKEQAEVVMVCAAIEAELVALEDEEQAEFMEALGIEEPGLNRVIRSGYQLLDLQTYFTAGKKEVRAWTIPVGATAPQAAGVIHTDFEKGFIRAEIMGFEDFITYEGENGCKEAGKWRLEGKDYIMNEGDIVHFRFNV